MKGKSFESYSVLYPQTLLKAAGWDFNNLERPRRAGKTRSPR